ncbi:MAG: twin-arginine translocase subunit TatC [Bryobacteraceae bacterium]
MTSPDEPKGADAPETESSSEPAPVVSDPSTDDGYGRYDDPYAYGESGSTAVPVVAAGDQRPPEPPPPPPPPEEDDDEGMLRMSFLEHLEELRARLIRIVVGIGVAFLVSLTFADPLWEFVQAPATDALKKIGADPPRLVYISPMEAFNITWVKLPVLCAVFLSSPWALYQVWGFIAPGLYRKERRWAAPFVISSAGLFILGGLFAYFVAFRFGLVFLLGIGISRGIQPMVSITAYFDLFINVILGVSLLFELPILIFFLTLLRIVTPRFLIRNSRYAILLIVVAAAILTPTPDIFNLMLFATPMIGLFYVGVFASYLLVLSREGRRFPWHKVLLVVAAIAAVSGTVIYFAVTKYGYQFIWRWPFLTR